MEKIGEGYWYNVFSLSEKRVRKVEKTYWQKIAHVFRLKKKQPIVFLRNAASFILERSNIITAYKHIEDRVDPSLLANPEFRNGIDYDQDCVRVLEDVFSTASTDRQKQIIDLYIDHIIVCLGYEIGRAHV